MNSNAGIHDPYWYESSIGLIKIIEMLNPDSNILNVTLQTSEYQGIDDICVEFNDGTNHFYQIKHTRVDDSLTFGDLVSISKDSKQSLLIHLAKAWEEAYDNNKKPTIILYSNRKIGKRRSTINKKSNSPIHRPALSHFVDELKKKVTLNEPLTSFSSITGFDEFSSQIDFLNNKKLDFIKTFKIDGNNLELDEVEEFLISQIKSTFSINNNQAKQILSTLDNALRKWATTFRNNEKIEIEDVWKVLSIQPKSELDCNYVQTPSPFFESRKKLVTSIEKELKNGTTSVIFLEGEPGIGKSSLVSKIAHKTNSYISLRYYTFKPITPNMSEIPDDSGDTAKPEIFWSELLDQLRSVFRGKLYEYEVPIRDNFLNVTQLRENVLRLSNELAMIKGQRVVISVDGIDHAARLNEKITFLNTLPSPENIPKNVCFFIIGQPIKSYPEYPTWLRKDRKDIKVFNIPRLLEKDIETLVIDLNLDKKFNPKNTAKIINEISSGNTLSVIYAVQEISNIDNLEQLKARLQKRKLSDNLENYYNEIWEYAFEDIRKYHLNIEQKISSLISLIKIPFDEVLLRNVFQEYGLTQTICSDILNHLSPLILNRGNKYTLLNNDFRVFLTNILKEKPNEIQYVANKLYNFYLSSKEYIKYKHKELIRLKTIGNSLNELTEIVTDEFVIEGAAIKRPLSELTEQHKIALKFSVYSKNSENLFSQLLVGLTIDKLNQSLFTIETNPKEDYILPNVLISELRIPPINEWEIRDIEQLFSDILKLIRSEELDRALDLYNSWISDYTPISLVHKLKPELSKEQKHSRDYKSVDVLLLNWGIISCHFGYLSFPKPNSDFESTIVAKYFGEFIKESARIHNLKKWKYSLYKMTTYYPKDLEFCLDFLFQNKSWSKLYSLLKFLSEKIEERPNSIKLKVLVYSILLNKKRTIKYYKGKLADNLFEYIDENDYQNSELYLLAISFIAGALRFDLDKTIILSNIQKKVKIHDEKEKLNFNKLLNIVCIIGRSYTEIDNSNNIEIFCSIGKYSEILSDLFAFSSNIFGILPYSSVKHLKDILGIILNLSDKLDDSYKKITFKKIIEYSERFETNSFIEPIWNYLYNCGNISLLKQWFEECVGEKGKVWKYSLEDRNDIVFRFIDLAEKYELDVDYKYVEQRFWANIISFIGNKDYSLNYPLDWFEMVSKQNPDIWRTIGIRLYNLSEFCSETGDNRIYHQVKEVLFLAAAKCNFKDLYQLTKVTDYYYENSDSIVNAMQFLIKSNSYSKEQLIGFWAFVIGTQRWQFESEQNAIIDFREQLNIVNSNLYSELKIETPTEWSIKKSVHSNSSEYKPKKIITKDELNKLTIDELINILDDPLRYFDYLSYFWKLYSVIIEKIKVECPTKLSDVIRKLKENIGTISYDEAYSYEYAIKPLEPFLNINDIWDIITSNYESGSFNINSINLFCRILSIKENNPVEDRLEKIVTTFEKWITGNYCFQQICYLKEEDIKNKSNEIRSWNEYILIYLLKRIESYLCSYTETALRGIWLLLITDGSTIKYLSDCWDTLNELQKELMLKLIEAYIYQFSENFGLIEPIIENCYNSSNMRLKFQSWNILEIYHRISGLPYKEMIYTEPENSDLISSLKNIPSSLIYNEGNKEGLINFSQGYSNILNKIKILNSISETNCSDIENRLSEYIKKVPLSNKVKMKKIGYGGSDTTIIQGEAFERFQEILYYDGWKGRWNDIPLVRMEQAVVSGDDPLIISHTAHISPHKNEWIIDNDLEKSKKNKTLKNDLKKIMLLHKKEDEIIIGGILYSFSSKYDIEYFYTTFVSQNNLLFTRFKEITSYNLKFNSGYYPNRFDPSYANGYTQLVIRTGGLYSLMLNNGLIFPSVVCHKFGWKPSKRNPKEWINKRKEIVLWFERYNVPIRKIYPSERYYKQPFIHLWKVKEEEIEKIQKKFKIKLNTQDYINVH